MEHLTDLEKLKASASKLGLYVDKLREDIYAVTRGSGDDIFIGSYMGCNTAIEVYEKGYKARGEEVLAEMKRGCA